MSFPSLKDQQPPLLRVRGNGAASLTPSSSSRPFPVTQHTGRNWLNAETVESCEGVRCHPARSSADVCQRGAVHQRMGGGNTQSGVSPHSQGARLALRLVHQGDGLHYPVGQPLFGDSLPFLLTSVAEKKSCSELLNLRVQSTYMRNAFMGHSNTKAGSASSEGSACRFTTWSRKRVVETLGTYPGRGLKTTWE